MSLCGSGVPASYSPVLPPNAIFYNDILCNPQSGSITAAPLLPPAPPASVVPSAPGPGVQMVCLAANYGANLWVYPGGQRMTDCGVYANSPALAQVMGYSKVQMRPETDLNLNITQAAPQRPASWANLSQVNFNDTISSITVRSLPFLRLKNGTF